MAEHPIRATLAGILLFVIGLAIAGGAYVNYDRERERLRSWQRVDGQVVALLQTSGGTRPVVSFSAEGQRIRFTAAGPLAARSHRVGDTVAVLYPVGDPSAARLESAALRWGRVLYAGTGSIVLMAMGGYLAWYARRRYGQMNSTA